MRTKVLLSVLLWLAVSPSATLGDVIAQWNFNSVPPDNSTSTGTNVPSVGIGTATLVGGVKAGYASGSTNDPATSTDDSGWNTDTYPAQSTSNKMAGVQFSVSTLGFSDITVRWDQRVSSTASKYYRFQYSVDGSTFYDFGPPIVAIVASASSQSYYEPQTNSLAGFSDVNNNFNFAFRIVSEFEDSAVEGGTNGYVTTYVTNNYSPNNGTVRFDLVTITGTPIPGANTPPTISDIPDQTNRVNQYTAWLPFTIGDAEEPATSLQLNKASSDQAVIPTSNISISSGGANCSVRVLAGPQPGTSIITLYVIDTGGRSNSTSFAVTVLPNNTRPTISTIPPTNTLVGVATPALGFTVNDLETPAAELDVSGTSANQSLVANDNIIVLGTGNARTVTVQPADGQTGVAPITLTVSDGTNTATTVFPLMVLPSDQVVFYDPFNYPDGAIITNSAFLWANRSGTDGEFQTTNGQLLVCGSLTEDILADLANGPYTRSNGTALYASFRLHALSLPKATPGYFAHFTGGNANRGRVYIGTENASPGFFRLGIANGSDSFAEYVADLSTSATYTVLTRYDIDSATTTLWLNPTSESDPSVTAADSQTAVNISGFGFREDSSVGANLLVDELRVGLSFSAVLESASQPARIPLNFQRVGASFVLSWSNPAFALQAAPFATGTYTNVPGASSPFTNAVTSSSKFFRLRSN